MKVANSRTWSERRTTLDVEDGPVRPQPWSRVGRQFRVDSVGVTWTRDDDENPWQRGVVAVWGVVLKKDGSDSLNRAEERFWQHNRGDWPQWLVDLVDLTTPPTPGRSRAVGAESE